MVRYNARTVDDVERAYEEDALVDGVEDAAQKDQRSDKEVHHGGDIVPAFSHNADDQPNTGETPRYHQQEEQNIEWHSGDSHAEEQNHYSIDEASGSSADDK